jgi:hypothetical protein
MNLSVQSIYLCQSVFQTKCPFVGGTAVYKARSLNTLYNPGAYYEDMEICNAVGIYKNGKGLFDDENEALNEMNSQTGKLGIDNLLKLYPNPASTQVNISYRTKDLQDSELKLYDMSGRFIVEVHLPASASNVSVNVENIASGVYTYKQMIGVQILSTGKFVKD